MLMALGLALYIFIWVRLHPKVTVTRPFDGDARQGGHGPRPGAAPVIILGGIFSGLFTPTESAGIAAVYMLLGLIYPHIDLEGHLEGGQGDGRHLRRHPAHPGCIQPHGSRCWHASRSRATSANGSRGSPTTGGLPAAPECAADPPRHLPMEAPPVILVLVPILMPIAAQFGIDPVHLGVIAILNLMIGSLTPPVGAVLFVVGSITRRPMGELFEGSLPFLIPLGVVLLLLTLFPVIVTIVPTLLGLM